MKGSQTMGQQNGKSHLSVIQEEDKSERPSVMSDNLNVNIAKDLSHQQKDVNWQQKETVPDKVQKKNQNQQKVAGGLVETEQRKSIQMVDLPSSQVN